MRSFTIMFAIAIALASITFFLVAPESDGFSVPAQRVITDKSAATIEKWDGYGKFTYMLWY